MNDADITMNDADIIKALEDELKTALTVNHRFMEACDTENPDDDRFIALLSDTLKLINRRNAEIERLEVQNKSLRMAANSYKMHYNNLKAEAIKEFAERLKESAFECDVSFGFGREHYTKAVSVVEIDNLVKEMMEGKK